MCPNFFSSNGPVVPPARHAAIAIGSCFSMLYVEIPLLATNIPGSGAPQLSASTRRIISLKISTSQRPSIRKRRALLDSLTMCPRSGTRNFPDRICNSTSRPNQTEYAFNMRSSPQRRLSMCRFCRTLQVVECAIRPAQRIFDDFAIPGTNRETRAERKPRHLALFDSPSCRKRVEMSDLPCPRRASSLGLLLSLSRPLSSVRARPRAVTRHHTERQRECLVLIGTSLFLFT